MSHAGMAAMYAAMYGGLDANASIYPTTVSSNTEQAQQSSYHGQRYSDIQAGVVHGVPQDEMPVYRDHSDDNARYTAMLVQYIMATMEPTDRCLRMPGDIYPADGTRAGKRGEYTGYRRPVPGDEPWDGVSDVPAPEDDA